MPTEAEIAEIIAKAEAGDDHLAILKLGVETWNRWREYYLDAPKLLAADLSGADLIEANLSEANLYSADLYHANLSNADLNNAHLKYADLRGANLSDASLVETDLTAAALHNADFTRAILIRTAFGDVDLSTAKGLDTVQHAGPSTIGLDTIYRSHGQIPECFLRGCGVPDEFIAYMHSLVATNAIEYYSCFISYSTADQPFADRLYADLQAKGVRCWFAPHDMQGGRKVHEQIDEAIRRYEKLLVILSPHSMSSEWVKTEIYNARQDEIKRGCRKLFPISLVPFETIKAWQAFDADTGKDMGREVREYFIPDFSNWETNADYQKAFARLLRDLKADDRGITAAQGPLE
jgi:uncharacterized protein YjbI with pentapeptide repeats